MVVVFPAPLGPRKPRISPVLTSNERSSIAFCSPYCLVRFRTVIDMPQLEFIANAAGGGGNGQKSTKRWGEMQEGKRSYNQAKAQKRRVVLRYFFIKQPSVLCVFARNIY